MVTFKLFSKNGDTLVYRYYPEGQVDYGVITVDRSSCNHPTCTE